MENDDELDPLFIQTVLLVSRLNDKFMELAHLLRALHETAPEDFLRIAKIRQLGVRKAYYLITISRAFRDLDVPLWRLNSLGWTKLAIVAPFVTGDNFEWWLSKAEKYDAENLKALVKGKPPIAGVRTILLRFSPPQFDIFARAIMAHGAKKKGDGFLRKESALVSALVKTLPAAEG